MPATDRHFESSVLISWHLSLSAFIYIVYHFPHWFIKVFTSFADLDQCLKNICLKVWIPLFPQRRLFLIHMFLITLLPKRTLFLIHILLIPLLPQRRLFISQMLPIALLPQRMSNASNTLTSSKNIVSHTSNSLLS